MKVIQVGFVIAMVLLATTAFAQVGVGVGASTQTNGNVGVSTPPVRAGASTSTNTSTSAATQANTGLQSKGATNATGNLAGSAAANSSANVATHIASSPKIADRVQTMLPSGMTMEQAAAGFKTQDQFVSALHASNDTKIPFDQLKTRMTGSSSASLEAAIKQSRPDMDDSHVSAAAKLAVKESKETLKN